MRKRILSLILALALAFSFVLPVFANNDGEVTYTSRSTFWSWLSSVSPIAQRTIGYLKGEACPESDDGRHHASVAQGEAAAWYYGDGYFHCICSECGQNFIAYETDVKAAYSDYVEELPVSIVGSDNVFYIKVSPSYFMIGKWAWSSYCYRDCPHAPSPRDETYAVGSFNCNHSDRMFSFSDVSGSARLGACFMFTAPISGIYTPLAGFAFRLDYVQDGTSCSKIGYYSDDDSSVVALSSSYYDAGQTGTFSYVTETGGGSQCSGAMSFAPLVYCIKPVTPIDVSNTSTNTDYNTGTRTGSIIGNYGIITSSGDVQQIDTQTIVNEGNHTIYNPVTNTTYGITDWTYDYDNRSYDITADDGSALTVTYGNENVTIVEPGGTYNVYYVTESESVGPTPTPTAGSGVLSPTPVAHTHSYISAVKREPSCTVSGVRTYTCECGESYTEDIPATGHTWQVKQDVKTQYDSSGELIQQGYVIYCCSVCGEEYKSVAGTDPPDNGGSSGSEESSGGGIFGKIGQLLGTVVGVPLRIIGGALGVLLDGLISLAESIGDKLAELVEMIVGWFDIIPTLFTGFLSFLSAMFVFLPEEITMLLTFGVTGVVFIGLLKAWRR